ncbi:putative secondary metabolism biosynthetic enzyme [Mucor velutinosus]|uniref:Secondary metabolism biosynthetic enzyme n=1 Tax=Mucor velutinosus TaxID=708070 RepID=A0AAN7HLP3_9FUNG|nr:putative secondary metabolism biosynthetic enzyme [Mucor velutinosus]
MINIDAETFTRLLTHLSDKISIQQMGFMPKQFIAEQGLQFQCMQTIATRSKLPSIALLLDQEKAYDRIHFSYLEALMKAFNIPSPPISVVLNFFSLTMIQPNVNGFLSTPLPQIRGLRQGDPLSHLSFNIAFDPFLRAVNSDTRIQGFSLPPDPLTGSTPSPVKILAYADDALAILNDASEFSALEELLQRYMAASKDLFNYNKTQALSLSGLNQPHWTQFLASKGISA